MQYKRSLRVVKENERSEPSIAVEINCFSWIIWWCIERQQERPLASGSDVIAVANAFGNDDEVADRRVVRVCANRNEQPAFEHVKFVIGVRMKMKRSTSRDLKVIHARLGCGVERPKVAPGEAVRIAIAKHVGAMHDSGRAVGFRRMALLFGSGARQQGRTQQQKAQMYWKQPTRKHVHDCIFGAFSASGHANLAREYEVQAPAGLV